MQFLGPCLAIAICFAERSQSNEPAIARPQGIEITATDAGGGWTKWEGIGDLEGVVGHRERVTSLHVAPDDSVWVGTSYGRLLRRKDGTWTLEAILAGVQITGIALQEDIAWLGTSDGMVRLQRPKERPEGHPESWEVQRFRHYYEGHPSFVSGAYIPGEDAVRLWGFVDSVFVSRQIKGYSPYVVSTEHGLFAWGRYHGVWHHFFPHFWGANSSWLDTRELLPHRRPTCLCEDKEGNLWIGTEGDGIVRINAHAREFYKREPKDNAKDGTEFTRFSSHEVEEEFVRVNDISAGLDGGIWAALIGNGKRRFVARYQEGKWSTVEPTHIERDITRNQTRIKTEWWEPTPLSLAEVAPGNLLVGMEDGVGRVGLFELDWEREKFEKVKEVEYPVRKVLKASDGTIWAQTWWGLYSRNVGKAP